MIHHLINVVDFGFKNLLEPRSAELIRPQKLVYFFVITGHSYTTSDVLPADHYPVFFRAVLWLNQQSAYDIDACYSIILGFTYNRKHLYPSTLRIKTNPILPLYQWLLWWEVASS